LPIPYPKQITENDNFLKIVSNIFFINGYKVWRDVQAKYLDTDKIPLGMVDKLYNSHLKETRRVVYAHFKVGKTKELNTKYIVRMYPYSVDSADPMRKHYTKLGDDINDLLDSLQKKIIPVLFLTESSDSKVFNPSDTIIDIAKIKSEVVDYNSLNC
jgi:hypothetical protein